MSNKRIRVGFLGDRPLIVDSFRNMLKKQPDLICCTTTHSSSWTSQPEVILIDSHEATDSVLSQLLRDLPHTKIIVINADAEGLDLTCCLRAGVMAFVLKDATWNELVDTVRTVAGGTRSVPAIIATRLYEQLEQKQRSGKGLVLDGNDLFTEREQEIAALIVQRLNNREIADKLSIAPFTVKNHIHNILRKLHCRNRADILELYWRQRAAQSASAGTPSDGSCR